MYLERSLSSTSVDGRFLLFRSAFCTSIRHGVDGAALTYLRWVAEAPIVSMSILSDVVWIHVTELRTLVSLSFSKELQFAATTSLRNSSSSRSCSRSSMVSAVE